MQSRHSVCDRVQTARAFAADCAVHTQRAGFRSSVAEYRVGADLGGVGRPFESGGGAGSRHLLGAMASRLAASLGLQGSTFDELPIYTSVDALLRHALDGPDVLEHSSGYYFALCAAQAGAMAATTASNTLRSQLEQYHDDLDVRVKITLDACGTGQRYNFHLVRRSTRRRLLEKSHNIGPPSSACHLFARFSLAHARQNDCVQWGFSVSYAVAAARDCGISGCQERCRSGESSQQQTCTRALSVLKTLWCQQSVRL